jgi:hypothetical protein
MSDPALEDAPSFDAQLYAESMPPRPGAPPDTGSLSQQAEAEQKRAVVAEQRREVVKALLSAPAGREFLAHLMFEVAGFTASTVSATNSIEGLHASNLFYAGRRDVGLRLHEMLRTADKSGYVVLLSEHVDKM